MVIGKINPHNSQDNGSIRISISGGAPPYLLKVCHQNDLIEETAEENVDTEGECLIEALSAGKYYLTLSDSLDHEITHLEMLQNTDEIKELQFTAISGKPISNYDSPDGELIVTAIGGVPPYEYMLNNSVSNSTGSFSGISQENCEIKVVDSMGQTHSEMINFEMVCFEESSHIQTDQGIRKASELNEKNTIGNQPIKQVVFSNLKVGGKLVKIPANSLGPSVPKFDTYVTPNHKIRVGVNMLRAEQLCHNGTRSSRNAPSMVQIRQPTRVYNLCLPQKQCVPINNMLMETLDPKSIVLR